eukprot:8143625-Pyramimonas_sp.AAC.1
MCGRSRGRELEQIKISDRVVADAACPRIDVDTAAADANTERRCSVRWWGLPVVCTAAPL